MLDAPYPCEVLVCGEPVAIRTGWRTGVRAMRFDMDEQAGRVGRLSALYGVRNGAGSMAAHFPDIVSAHPSEALLAASEWLSDGLGQMRYAGNPKKAERRAFDLDADAAIIACDFQRLYGVDLADPETRMHWYRFCALLLGAMRTDGSLIQQAVQARLRKVPAHASQETKEAIHEAREAWKLPPTKKEELARLARLMR